VTATKKNCPWCGIANAEEAQSCVGCGSELNPAAAVKAPSAAAPEVPKAEVNIRSAAPKPKSKAEAKTPKPALSMQIRPGYVYASIAAVVILGYLYMKNDAPVPVVPQNTELNQSDSTAQSIASMEQFLSANPNDSKAQLAYANMLHDAKMFPRAIAAYKKYLDSDAKNPDARVDMAICYFESGNAAEALVQLQKTLGFAPTHQPAMFNLGIVYLNQEKVKESNDWFSRCAAVDPSTPIAARAQQLLSQHSSTNKNLQ
jgi:tetratricopeptide (TPR) repeat protein